MNTRQRYRSYALAEAATVTELPRHWNAKRMRFVCEVNPSKSRRKLSDGTLVSFVPMEAVGEYGGLTLNAERAIEEIGAGYTYFEDGDVVVAKITPCFENGKGALAKGLANGVAYGTTELHVIRSSQIIRPRFLFYVTVAQHFRGIGESEMYGAGGQKRVPESFLKNFRVLLPPPEEQDRIVEFIDDELERIDALATKKRTFVELLNERERVLITEAVTRGLDPKGVLKKSGVQWLGQIPAHWRVKQLRHMIRYGTVITYGIVQAGPDVGGGGIPYIRTSDMDGDELPLAGYLRTSPEIDAAYSRSKVSAGDLVIAIRATIGKPLIVPPELEGANLTQGTAKFSPGPETSAEYVKLFLRSAGAVSEFARLSKGVTFKEITLEMLRKFVVLQPPLIEQEAIARYLNERLQSFNVVRKNTQKSLELLFEYRSALITNAVTGKIDVRSHVKREAAE